MLPTYVHVSAKSSIPPSFPVAKINFWANQDGIKRELYMEGEGYGVSIMVLLVKERGREARPARFVENLSGSTCLLHVDWCWWQYGVEWACTITLLAGAPVMASSERKGLERLGYRFQLGHNIITRIASYWLQEDDWVFIEIVSAHKVWALFKNHESESEIAQSCPTLRPHGL